MESDEEGTTTDQQSDAADSRKGWFDSVWTTKASRLWKSGMQKLEEAGRSAISTVQACLAEFETKDNVGEFDKEQKIVKQRAEALEKVLGTGNAEADRAKFEEFKASLLQPGASGHSGESVKTDEAIAKAPPCQGFEHILVLTDLYKWAEEIEKCSSKDELTKALKEGAVPSVRNQIQGHVTSQASKGKAILLPQVWVGRNWSKCSSRARR